MNYNGQERATSHKRVRYADDVDYYEDSALNPPYYHNTPYSEVFRESYRPVQDDTIDRESVDFAAGYGMQPMPTNPKFPATNNDSTNQPVEGRKLRRANMKMDELVRAQRILPNDELKWANTHNIKCKIMVRSIGKAHTLNLTVTYESSPNLPTAGSSSNTTPYYHHYNNNIDSSPSTNKVDYLNVQGPTKIEDLLSAHCGIPVPEGKHWGNWSDFSVHRNGVNMGTLTELRLQLVDDYNSGDAGLATALLAARKKRGPMPLRLRKGEVTFHERLGGLAHDFDEVAGERDAAVEVARRLYALVGEMMVAEPAPGLGGRVDGTFVKERMREIEMATTMEGRPGLWEKVVQRGEVFEDEDGAMD